MSQYSRDYRLVLRLGQRPLFCFCCWCLNREDTWRARRVFRLTRAIMKSWNDERVASPPSDLS